MEDREHTATATTTPGPAEPRDASGPDPLPGTLLTQRYEIQRRLGAGGMGEILANR